MEERVRFERRQASGDDGYGNTIYDWQSVAGPMAARIKPARGDEEILAQRLAGTAVYEIIVRWCAAAAAIISGDRCVNERSGTIYNIKTIQNMDERRRYFTLTVESGGAT
jgi:SPP1 family predicted phage head-tail adaptor